MRISMKWDGPDMRQVVEFFTGALLSGFAGFILLSLARAAADYSARQIWTGICSVGAFMVFAVCAGIAVAMVPGRFRFTIKRGPQ